MQSVIFVYDKTDHDYYTFVHDLSEFTHDSDIRHISGIDPYANNFLYVVELCCVHNVITRYNILPENIIAVGHCEHSYHTIPEQSVLNRLRDYVVVDHRLDDYSANRLQLPRRPVVLPYGLHVDRFRNCKRFNSSFKVACDATLPTLDTRNTEIFSISDYGGIHVVLCTNQLNIPLSYKAIASGCLLVGYDCAHTRDLQKHGLAFVIPEKYKYEDVQYGLTLCLEYLRTTPRIYLKAMMNSRAYSKENFDWNVVSVKWVDYLNDKRCLL